MPSNLKNLKNIEKLNLSENKIQFLDLNLRKMKRLCEVKIFLNPNIAIDARLINILMQRISWSSSQFNLLIDQKQAEKLTGFERYFRPGKIGVIDFKNKLIPSGHYKQIGLDIVNKYELKDQKIAHLRERNREKEKSSL